MKETSPNQIKESPEIGGYIYGLFIEAAHWNSEKDHLEEAAPKVLFNKMPLIWLVPMQQKAAADKSPSRRVRWSLPQDYSCPVYKTSKRQGVLATTGHSSNYVLSIEIPISKSYSQEHWIKRGVAMLCQLDD